MSDRIYDIVLECGCMLSADAGGGLIPCYAEYGDMRKKKDREALKLHEKCWKEWHGSKKQKEFGKEVRRRNK